MEEIEELKERLGRERPVGWDSLPDLSLYMDQVIGYMSRQLIHYNAEETLTSAMVNNYIKDGLLPRAEGKRYNRTHLAYLTQICALKQILPVKDAGLLAQLGEKEDVRAGYEKFRALLDAALAETAKDLDAEIPEEDLGELAITLALRSYADKLACERVIELIRARSGAAGEKPKKRKGEANHE